MAYRTSRAPYEELKDILEGLLEHRETVEFYTDNPRRLCYRLREAIHASSFHKDLKKFLALKKLYAFEDRDGYVRARFRGSDDITKVEVKPDDRKSSRRQPGKTYPSRGPTIPPEALEAMTSEIETAAETCTLENIGNLAGIIEGTKRYGNRALEVYFPQAFLDTGDLTRLHRWTSSEGWIIVNMEEAGLTLSKREIPEELQWKPKNSE